MVLVVVDVVVGLGWRGATPSELKRDEKEFLQV